MPIGNPLEETVVGTISSIETSYDKWTIKQTSEQFVCEEKIIEKSFSSAFLTNCS